MATAERDDPVHHDPEWLRSRLKLGMTQMEMAEEAGVSNVSIHNHIKKHDLEVDVARKPHWDEEWLRRKYHDEEMSMEEMAERAGVSRSCVFTFISNFGIETRGFGPSGVPEDELLEDIGRVARLVGGRPLIREYRELGDYSESAVISAFGGGGHWIAAMEEVGLARRA